MDCPHGWTDCQDCLNLAFCEAGTYVPEPEPPEPTPDPESVNELEENELARDLGKELPRGTWAEQFSKLSHNDRMSEFYRYHPDDLISKEPYKAMPGAFVPGGSKNGRSKNKKKGTKIVIEPWTSEV
jgi:hypothetical protein